MKTFEPLADVRRALAAIEDQAPVAPELDELRPVRLHPGPSERRSLRVVLAWAAAFAVIALPAALLLGDWPAPENPGSVGGDPDRPLVASEDTNLPAPDANGATLGGVEVDQVAVLTQGAGSAIPTIARAHDGFVAVVKEGDSSTVWRGSSDGTRWEPAGMVATGDTIVSMAARGETLVALGARDGSQSQAYVSSDSGLTWQSIALPTPADATRFVPQVVTATDAGFVVGGIGTATDFDSMTGVYVWRSDDGVRWDVEKVDQIADGFAYVEDIVDTGAATVVLYGGPDGMPYAVESTGGGWSRAAIGTVTGSALTAPAGETVGYGLVYVGAQVDGAGGLHTWWERWNASPSGGRVVAVLRDARGDWQAKDTQGEKPTAIELVGENVVGVAGSRVLGSYAGIVWHRLAVVEGTVLDAVLPIGERSMLVTGSEVTGERGRDNAAVWLVTLDGTVQEVLGIPAAG